MRKIMRQTAQNADRVSTVPQHTTSGRKFCPEILHLNLLCPDFEAENIYNPHMYHASWKTALGPADSNLLRGWKLLPMLPSPPLKWTPQWPAEGRRGIFRGSCDQREFLAFLSIPLPPECPPDVRSGGQNALRSGHLWGGVRVLSMRKATKQLLELDSGAVVHCKLNFLKKIRHMELIRNH